MSGDFGWIEPAGERWRTMLGDVYLLVAVKRGRGLRVVGLDKPVRLKRKAAAAMVAQRRAPTPAAPATSHETWPLQAAVDRFCTLAA